MPMLHLLPVGTVIKCKDPSPGWENLRFMVTSYFPVEKNGDRSNDYTITPWPLGYVNLEGGGREIFFSCDEDGIEEVEFLGAVDDAVKEKTDSFYAKALKLSNLTCSLVQGAEPMMHSYGDLPVTIGNIPFDKDKLLPLGTVISTAKNGSQKGMIYQHGGTYRGKHYDYGVCAWPEGADPGSDIVQLINHDEITAVHFRGYENALSQEVAKRLEKKRRGSLFTRLFGK